jgi:hypothetical protein
MAAELSFFDSWWTASNLPYSKIKLKVSPKKACGHRTLCHVTKLVEKTGQKIS